MTAQPASDRVRVRRAPHKAAYDHESVAAVLGRALVAHVAFLDDDQPLCIPMLYAHVDDRVYVHGSSKSRALLRLASGAPACLTVTVINGLVLARSVYEHSANYESVVALGRFEPVADVEEKREALRAFTDRLVPGRWDEVRPPTDLEVKASAILRLPLDHVSVKRRSGPPDDGASPDADLPVWAGVLPIVTSFDRPVTAPDLRRDIDLSPSVRRLTEQASPARD